jgi:cytochrome o ubiquinol oxidase subunit IV
MHDNLSLKEIQKEWHGTLHSYVVGFICSFLLTGISFFLVATKFLTAPALIYILVSLAVFQAILQLIFFLHLGQEAKPRWESVVFYFMVMILLILAGGSLWIMHNLNDRMMIKMEVQHD